MSEQRLATLEKAIEALRPHGAWLKISAATLERKNLQAHALTAVQAVQAIEAALATIGSQAAEEPAERHEGYTEYLRMIVDGAEYGSSLDWIKRMALAGLRGDPIEPLLKEQETTEQLPQWNLKYWVDELLRLLEDGQSVDDPPLVAAAHGLLAARDHFDKRSLHLPDLTLIREQVETGLTFDVEHQCPATFALACIATEVIPEHEREPIDPDLLKSAIEDQRAAVLPSDEEDPIELLELIVREYEQTYGGEVHSNGDWTDAASIPVQLMERAKAYVKSFREPNRQVLS